MFLLFHKGLRFLYLECLLNPTSTSSRTPCREINPVISRHGSVTGLFVCVSISLFFSFKCFGFTEKIFSFFCWWSLSPELGKLTLLINITVSVRSGSKCTIPMFLKFCVKDWRSSSFRFPSQNSGKLVISIRDGCGLVPTLTHSISFLFRFFFF